ncbi:hypothetical protein [Saccharothrix carnea]|nr:hypothetical protein [Saccharothrix carnea]
MAVGVITRLPVTTTKFVRTLVPLIRACRDVRAELRERGHQRADRAE